MRSPLDNLHPDRAQKAQEVQERQKQGHDAHAQVRLFKVGDLVYAKNYGSGSLWLPGKITGVQGSVMYTVSLDDGRIVTKHADQLRSRTSSSTNVSLVPEEDDVGLASPNNAETTPPVARETMGATTPEAGEASAVELSASPSRLLVMPELSPVIQDGTLPESAANSGGAETGVVPTVTAEPHSPESPEPPDPPETRRSGRSHTHPDRYGNFHYY